jgi:crotonobetainyl-CoA:carnitine CoA-transferase CaiB-like acyl-CoA transferase
MTFRPLAGLRVVEVGHGLSAAYGARLLADLGAVPVVFGDDYRFELGNAKRVRAGRSGSFPPDS